MNAQAFLSQLYAMRNQVDAMILVLQDELGNAATNGCSHPETENVGTLAERKLRCVRCKEIVDL